MEHAPSFDEMETLPMDVDVVEGPKGELQQEMQEDEAEEEEPLECDQECEVHETQGEECEVHETQAEECEVHETQAEECETQGPDQPLQELHDSQVPVGHDLYEETPEKREDAAAELERKKAKKREYEELKAKIEILEAEILRQEEDTKRDAEILRQEEKTMGEGGKLKDAPTEEVKKEEEEVEHIFESEDENKGCFQVGAWGTNEHSNEHIKLNEYLHNLNIRYRWMLK